MKQWMTESCAHPFNDGQQSLCIQHSVMHRQEEALLVAGLVEVCLLKHLSHRSCRNHMPAQQSVYVVPISTKLREKNTYYNHNDYDGIIYL